MARRAAAAAWEGGEEMTVTRLLAWPATGQTDSVAAGPGRTHTPRAPLAIGLAAAQATPPPLSIGLPYRLIGLESRTEPRFIPMAGGIEFLSPYSCKMYKIDRKSVV